MDHQTTIEGFSVRLRPVKLGDAEFIVRVRCAERVVSVLGESAGTIEAQRKWIEEYLQRENDYYFIVETLAGISVGTYGLYNFMEDTAELGRWIILPDVPAALPSVFVMLPYAFDYLKLRALRACTWTGNRKALSIHLKLGWEITGVEPSTRIISGKPAELIWFRLEAEDWPAVRERWARQVLKIEQVVLEWERTVQPANHKTSV